MTVSCAVHGTGDEPVIATTAVGLLHSIPMRMKSTAFYLDMIPVLAIDPSQSRDGFG